MLHSAAFTDTYLHKTQSQYLYMQDRELVQTLCTAGLMYHN